VTTQQRLFGRYLKDTKPGLLVWIGVRPQRKAAMLELEQVLALEGLGLQSMKCRRVANSMVYL